MRARRGRIDAAWLGLRLDEIEAALARGDDEAALGLYFDAARSPVREGQSPQRVGD